MSQAQGQLRESLRKFAAEPARASIHALWRSLTNEERELAIDALLESGDDRLQANLRRGLVALVAHDRHFREITVNGWERERLVRAAARCQIENGQLLRRALVQFHLAERKAMLGRFYDLIGIKHKDGEFDTEVPVARAIHIHELFSAADVIEKEYALDDVVVFLITLLLFFPEQFGAIKPWLTRSVVSDGATADLPRPPVSFSEAPRPVSNETDTHGFTTLDRRLIRTVVDTVQGVTGAASIDEVDDLIFELIQLNSSRHQTFFHAGFRDALFGRALAQDIVGDNQQRRQWYWAGAVAGTARSGNMENLVKLFDAQASVKELGRATTGAGGPSAPSLFGALTSVRRFAEATAFLSPSVVTTSVELQQQLLSSATALIRENQPAEARAMLDLAWHAYQQAQANSGELNTPYFRELRRRRAVCFRQLGQAVAAEELLTELISDADPVTRAIALTDLGLLRAGVRRLGELRIPDECDDVSSLVESLKKGEELFLEAVTASDFRPAHAQFALGILDCAEKRFAAAVPRLEEALSHFLANPEVYEKDGTLSLGRTYLGVAICQSMDVGKLKRACEEIRAGMLGGARVPRWLIADTLDSLEAGRSDLVEDLTSAILDSDSDGALDALAGSTARSTAAVGIKLLARADVRTRSESQRVTDYRAALPILLLHRELAGAERALIFLEDAAVRRTALHEFEEVLSDPSNYSPAWDKERAFEAKIRLLESESRYVDAAAILESTAHQILATHDDDSLDDVELILLRLESYGSLAKDAVERVRNVLDPRLALQAEEADDEVLPNVDVRIMVVGGNEVQARMEEDIRRKMKETHPRVSLEFHRTGWTSNWSDTARDFERRVANVDGVVFLYLMRTMFGRTVRRQCNVPWVGCGRKGQGAILESIRRLQPMAARYAMNGRVLPHTSTC